MRQGSDEQDQGGRDRASRARRVCGSSHSEAGVGGLEGSGIAALVVAEAESGRLDAAEESMGPEALEVVLAAGSGVARAEIEFADEAARERLSAVLAAGVN